MPPIIGLTTYGYEESHTVSSHYDHHFSIPKEYVDAVIRAGGIPLLIPANDNDWQSLWTILDGIIVTGGTDIAPHFYGGDAQNANIHAKDFARDATEIALLKHAVASKAKPILCICRGMQVLNVALGGTLHPHIPSICEHDIHRNEEGLWTLHDCLIKPDSQLAHIMKAKCVTTVSGHHQAIDNLANGLEVVATAPDGIIEAIIFPDHPWLVGVQWHPEKSADTDPSQQNLFDELVKIAEK